MANILQGELIPAPDSKSAELRRGWRPLLASAIGLGIGLSPLTTYSLGLFVIALHHAFGWSRGQILLAPAIGTMAILLGGPFVGRISDRIGVRRVALLSTTAFGLTLAAGALIQSTLWSFFLFTLIMSCAGLGTLPITYAKVVNGWFNQARGLALGLALCATGAAGFFVPNYVQFIIGNFGWRWAYVALGMMPIVIGVPALLLLLRGDTPDEADDNNSLARDGLDLREGLLSWRYWLMALSALAAGAALSGMIANLAPLLIDRGLNESSAAAYLGLVGISVIVGRILIGWLLDLLWAPIVASSVFILSALAALILLGAVKGAPLSLAVILIGIGGGAEFDILAYITSRYFGRRNFATFYSGQYGAFAVGGGTAPFVIGWLRDRNGSYDLALYGVIFLLLVASIALLILGRYPRQKVPSLTSCDRQPC